MKKLLLLLSIILISISSFSQKINESFQFNIKKTDTKIKIDGVLDDEAWSKTDIAKDFWMMTPMDTSQSLTPTEVRLTYDDNFLYISAICHEKIKNKGFVVESLKRDFNFGNNDNFWFILEPFNDLTNGFVFGVNAAGAQFDGIISEGTNLNANWDNKWFSETKYLGDRWIFEAAIPFKTLRYKAGVTKWGMNFSRLDLKSGEKSTWARIPRQYFSITLAYTGTMNWETPPPTPKSNISIIPYALGGTSKNFQDGSATSIRRDVGLDAKIAVSSALNLDLTVNPDFSQVDVDKQVTNLSRFELFFPERRQFFLENADLFNNFGLSSIRPFFSRRIGLGVPINYGARLSGKINNNLRIGVMNIQTGTSDLDNRPGQNFSALVLQQKVFSRSNISMMLLNKQSLNYDEIINKGYNQYNRNFGFEYNLASASNLWTGKAMYLKSYSPNTKGDDFVSAFNVYHNGLNFFGSIQYEYVGSNYNPEIGYVPRVGYHKIAMPLQYNFYPKQKESIVQYHAPAFTSNTYWNTEKVLTDFQRQYYYLVTMKDRSSLTAYYETNYIKLPRPFDPTNKGSDDKLAVGSEHRFSSFNLNYLSTPRKRYTFGFTGSYGSYFGDGKLLSISSDFGYRFQPYVSLSANINYVDISDVKIPVKDQADKIVKSNFWLVSPKIDITFTNKLFWTTFIQYNEQVQNVNINSRVQWRYKPASDIFLVYTDNYIPGSLNIKNRAIVLKFTYWWNL
ncbi:DUF5916 domain-containing protein [Arcicella lustrica]|uniref:DUF5916 domain-containing protein n=1 Tax=Arcicella lustrica TaxID=2984196 RepID=A0ABU5SLE8_9BACT|nr:DUF5916 domain-containing protein [Arcicella sp. DC25W]MEA5428133.1 DUF5916 domain-containing protein [Arcicella sp. DC25W]